MPSFHFNNLPSLANCALNASQSALPEAWDGLLGLWSPLVGHQGMGLVALGAGQNAPFTNLTTSAYVYDQPGLALEYTTGANRYADTGLTMASASQYTSLVLWRRRVAGAGVYVAGSTGSSAESLGLMVAHTDGFVYGHPKGNAVYGRYASNDALWHVTVSRFDGTQATNATRVRAWHDGEERTLSFTGTIPAPTSATPGTVLIGYRPVGTLRSDGRIGAVIIWNRALPADLIRGLSVRPLEMLRRPQRRNVFGKASTAKPWLYARRGSQLIGGGVL